MVGDRDPRAIRAPRADRRLRRRRALARRPRRRACPDGRAECECRAWRSAGPLGLGRIAVNDKPIAPTSAPDLRFMPGDLVRLKTPGGGGHGEPAQRADAEVRADLTDGYISSWPAARACRPPTLCIWRATSAARTSAQ